MAENELPITASLEWMTIPFEIHSKTYFDRLVDVLFAVQTCLSVANELVTSSGHHTAELEERLDIWIRDATLQLDQWWSQCTSTDIFELEKSASLWDSEKPPLRFPNIPVAALVSLCNAANVIILRLLYLVSSSAAAHTQRAQNHAQSILAANDFVNAATGPAPDRGSTMMVLQLKIVSLWSPSSQQRDAAFKMLQSRKVRGGGLQDIATVSHDFYADLAAHIDRNYGPLDMYEHLGDE